MEHGGDWAGYRLEFGGMPLDFSASVSPLGLPERVRQAAASALDCAERYPDPLCRELRERLAEYHGVPAEHIICGGGASDLIYRLVLAVSPKTALVTAPTFSEYENALSLCGCRVSRFLLYRENGFAVSEDILRALDDGPDMLFLCEPNNPTGRTTPPGLLKRILDKCALCGTLLVIDECFIELLDEPEKHTMLGSVSEYLRLFILRAFTKSFGMAGLRLGYGICSDGALLDAMNKSGPPWPVSGPAQAAGVAALKETEYLTKLRKLIHSQRCYLTEGLTELGMSVCPGEANFLLFFSPVPSLGQRLREKGILIRDCSGFHGLGPGWYRVAVRIQEDNRRLLDAVREVL